MGRDATPMREFDLLAGAKASYEEFNKHFDTPPKPWENLTQAYQLHWVAILKTGIKAGQATRKAKERRVTR